MLEPDLRDRRIAFTSPASYAEFLQQQLEQAGAEAIWMPTISIQQSDRTRNAVQNALINHLSQVQGIAFTSRNGIRAVAEVLPKVFSALPKLNTPSCWQLWGETLNNYQA